MSSSDDEDGFEKGCALIRSNLGISIESIKEEKDWAYFYAQALWLENFRLERQARMISGLFANDNK